MSGKQRKPKNNGRTGKNFKANSGRGSAGPTAKMGEKEQIAQNAAPTSNDPKWYQVFPTLTSDAARLTWNLPTGVNYAGRTQDTTVDGAVIRFSPIVGIAKNASDPVNMLAKSLYSQIRKENSGAKNYSSLVPIMYLLAVDNLYVYIEWMKRVYAEVFTTTPFNRALPQKLLEAESIDYLDVKDHAADFRKHIDWMIHMTTTFALPKDIWVIQRHRQLVANLYLDSPSAYAQAYVFSPSYLYKWKSVSNKLEAFNVADYVNTSTNRLDYAGLVNMGKDMIDAFVSMPDTSLLAGDIMKAYGATASEYTSFPDDNPTMSGIYDEEVLDMIHNIDLLGSPTATSEMDIVANLTSEILEFNPKFGGGPGWGYNQANYCLMDTQFNDGELTPEYTLAIARGVSHVIMDSTSTLAAPVYTAEALGTEVFHGMSIIREDPNGTGTQALTIGKFETAPNTAAGISYAIPRAMLLSKLNCHPKVTFAFYNGSTPTSLAIPTAAYQWDVMKQAIVAPEVVTRMHEAALWNLLSVPRA